MSAPSGSSGPPNIHHSEPDRNLNMGCGAIVGLVGGGAGSMFFFPGDPMMSIIVGALVTAFICGVAARYLGEKFWSMLHWFV